MADKAEDEHKIQEIIDKVVEIVLPKITQAVTEGMKKPSSVSSTERTPAQLKRDWEYYAKHFDNKGMVDMANKVREAQKKSVIVHGGSNPIVLPPYGMEKSLRIEALQSDSTKGRESEAADSGQMSDLLRKFSPSSTADATGKLFGKSEWLYKKVKKTDGEEDEEDEKGKKFELIPEEDRKVDWASNWNEKELIKCIVYGDTNQLCKCIEGIPEGDSYTEEFVKSLSSDELQKLFKLFGVHLQRVDCVLVPPRAKDWKNSFPCSNKSPNVIKFIVDCIELCSDPENYLLLNTQEDVDCYRELKNAQKKKQCETLRTKPPRNETSSPLCPQQVYAPTNAFYQLGGSVNYVNQNSTIGKFLMSGGRITKQSGGVTDNACCANMLEASLNAVVNQLKSQGKRISDSDLNQLKSDIAIMGRIEANLRTLIEKKLKIYSYSLGSRNCRPGDEAEVLELAEIADGDNAMGEKLKADYELCSKQIQGSCDQYNQLVSSFTNGLNALQLQPVGFGF